MSLIGRKIDHTPTAPSAAYPMAVLVLTMGASTWLNVVHALASHGEGTAYRMEIAIMSALPPILLPLLVELLGREARRGAASRALFRSAFGVVSVLAVLAFAISVWSISSLAMSWGLPLVIAASFPIVLDLAAAASTLFLLDRALGEQRSASAVEQAEELIVTPAVEQPAAPLDYPLLDPATRWSTPLSGVTSEWSTPVEQTRAEQVEHKASTPDVEHAEVSSEVSTAPEQAVEQPRDTADEQAVEQVRAPLHLLRTDTADFPMTAPIPAPRTVEQPPAKAAAPKVSTTVDGTPAVTDEHRARAARVVEQGGTRATADAIAQVLAAADAGMSSREMEAVSGVSRNAALRLVKADKALLPAVS